MNLIVEETIRYKGIIAHWIDNDYKTDIEISDYLNLSLEEYYDILKKHNARSNVEIWQESSFYLYYFLNKEDAERAIKALEPYIILATLTE